jgi:UDP-glucose 4-epimerase
MKICITGGAGFIGSNIAEKYLKLGHDVVIIDNLSLGFKENIPSGAKFYEIDINNENLIDIFKEEKFDVVNHHAAQMSVRHSVSLPLDDAQTNILGGINIFDCAAKTGVKKVIFSSSAGTVYGEQTEFPCDETHQNLPISPYGVSKYATEKYLQYYNSLFGLNYTIFRYTNVYGRRQNPHGEAGVIAIFFSKMINDEDTYLTGKGLISRDYVYVDDVVEANVKALELEQTGIFNIATGIEVDLHYIFDKLSSITGYKKPKVLADFKLGEQLRSVCTSKKFSDLTGWSPKINLEQGLAETYKYYKSLVS